jgi:hypothetical protein
VGTTHDFGYGQSLVAFAANKVLSGFEDTLERITTALLAGFSYHVNGVYHNGHSIIEKKFRKRS